MKKWISVLCACAMFFGIFAATATADTAVEFAVGSVTAKPGDTVQIPVTISEDHYIVNTRFFVNYDPTALELQVVNETADCPYINDWNTSLFTADAMWAGRLVANGDLRVVYATASNVGKAVGGTLFTLTFKVIAETAGTFPVSITMKETCSNSGSGDYVPQMTLTSGGVTIKPSKGDINCDGTVDIADATMLFRYINARITLTEEQLAQAELAAPSDKVTIGDALVLFRYANGRITKL